MSSWYFFLSYARVDRENDKHDAIGRFYADLVEEVRRRRGLAVARIGFFDRQKIEPGERWPDELEEALRTCSAFVPVLSASYFSREYCGREWAVFRSRLDAYSKAAGAPKTPPLIQPLLLIPWHELDPLPPAIADEVADLQFDKDPYPAVYATEGLHYMMRLKEHADDYERLINHFADALIGAVDAHELPPAEPISPIKGTQSAFHQERTSASTTASTAEAPIARSAQFIYVAGRRDELTAVRNDVSHYGPEGGLDWKPYCPDVEDEVAIIAQDVASREKLRYEGMAADATLGDMLRTASEARKIVVVIADIWTLRLDAYRELMREIDDRDLPNCVVLVPWNLTDQETASNRQQLANIVALAFVNKVAGGETQRFVDRIESEKEFREELGKALQIARMQLIRIEDVRRRAAGGDVIAQPTVVGPGATA
jgi:FxsC-like protein